MTRPPHRVARRLAPVLVALTVVLPGGLVGQADGSYVVRDLAPGVFAAMAPPDVPSYLFANSLVVVGEAGVLVVDPGQRPELARALVARIRERTDRPVRWLVNTHWHGDHVWGNAVFRDAFPGVRILATPATRDSVAGSSARQVQEQLEQERAGRARLEAMMDTADAALRARIRAADSARAARIAELEALRIVEPTEMFTERTELDLGGRTAVLLPLGPAHTPGDAAVWLPGEGILAVGDLLEAGELWLEGADVPGWTRALDALADLDAGILVPSHGGVSDDGALLAAGRAQLRDRALLRDSTDILFSVTGLEGPEAVRYDPDQDVYFIANFGERADDQRDANGFISRVSAEDGAVEALRFMGGTAAAPLHMPRGMFIRGDTLWVADVDGVHGFLRQDGRHAAFIDFRTHEPGFLNDIAAGPDGLLYVTDTGLGRVYRVRRDGGVEVAVEDERTGPPNGITWDPSRSAFLLAPWGGGTTLRAWDPATGAIRDVAELPGGSFDGIELVDGGVLVASQDDTSLHLLDAGRVRRLIRVPGQPADIGVDTRRGRVAVPYIALGRVDVWPIRPPADPADVASPEAIVLAAYESLIRAPGEPFQWERFASLFAPGARMVPNTEQTGGELRVMTVAEFRKWVDDFYAEHAPIGGPDDHGFAEEQIHAVTHRYGDVVQVMSTYQKRLWDSDEVLGRGINAMTLVFNEGRWWILSNAWDEEGGAGPIPPDFLP